MPTIAQMFPLDTSAALSFFPWTWSSAASTTVVFSTRCPTAASPCAGQGGGPTGGVDTPLCGCDVAPHSLLHPVEVTWKGDGSFKLRTAQDKHQGERWECNIWSRWPPCSCRSQYGSMLTKGFHMKISLDWLSWGEKKPAGVVAVEWIMGPCSCGLILCFLLVDPRWNNLVYEHHLKTGCSAPAAFCRNVEQSWNAYLLTYLL